MGSWEPHVLERVVFLETYHLIPEKENEDCYKQKKRKIRRGQGANDKQK